jgi:succinate dehydrogenase/fumarate reductase cytochrome b subunit
MRVFHKINALFLALFLVIHLATHLSGIAGIATYDSVQAAFRVVYTQPVVEVILLASITLQLIVGANLLIRSLRKKRPCGFWHWTQIISGGFFFVFMTQHLFSLGMARLYFNLDTTFYWPASVMSGPPFIYYFIPYYFFGVFAVIAHLGVGVRYWIRDAGHGRLANKVGIAFLVLGAGVSAAILPIISGAFFEIDLPQEWIDYLRWYAPSFEPR